MILDIIQCYEGTSIIDKNGSYTFNDLIKQIDIFSNELDNNIKKFDSVMIYSDYNFYSIALLIYLSSKNINIIPIVKTTKSEYESKLNESKPNFIIKLEENGNFDIKSNEIDYQIKNSVILNGHTGLVLFSSGTSGKPKLIVQNFTKLINSIKKPRKQKSLKFLIFLMFDHIGGINTLLNCLISGTPIVIPKDRNTSTIINLISKESINVLPTSPTFLNLILMDEGFMPNKFDSLKLITYGTERMPENLLLKLNTLLPKIKLLQTFGTSETGIIQTKSKSSSSNYFKIVDSNCEHKIINNELFLKSTNNIENYVNQKSNNFKDNGWYATGDIVEKDSDGFIKIIARKNKIINVGGLKVLPSEVEEVINSVNGVVDSHVFSQENIILGNIVCANVFTNSSDNSELKLNIKKHCKLNLDKYKIPMKIVFKSLKINSRGKKLT